uniref:Reverse transcriptase Ty1/copia-type domain-containing protein n=1 Tax=Chromera velia CCMP2878 TaxID=1169474 RepID=A0A0G4HUE7_9ALVE|eukprot:Cvel_8634.t1-p1 / transcript=Cvel_8634.t1 / gene=Cvel_8634 / organism=Chromera_velia_CCMP2878 / gene_product=hypothetical protein / transcript_product=hypothetical protein / location=Cvel_scaffold481:2635-9448(-) / protein_length=295 / sequence_SO=supercontig / SO=protein_coding / is_pseudo=false
MKGGKRIAKSRLVARGFQDPRDAEILKTYSGTADAGLARVAFVWALSRGWEAAKVDVSTAFLQAPIEDGVWLRLPHDLPVEVYPGLRYGVFIKIVKAVYGLKDAPKKYTDYFKRKGISICAAISKYGATKLYRLPVHTTPEGKESKRLIGEKYLVFVRDYLLPAMEENMPCGRYVEKHAFYDCDSSHADDKVHHLAFEHKLTLHPLAVKMWLCNIIEKYWGIMNTEVYEGGTKVYDNVDDLWAAMEVAHNKYWGVGGRGKEISLQMAAKVPAFMKAILKADGQHISAAQARKISF